MTRAISLAVCLFAALSARAALPAPLEGLVAEAWEHNLALAQKGAGLEAARARLLQARSAFEPRVDLAARYTVSDGGRTIDLPLGDLLNGAYATLNDYLADKGKAAAFPQLQNQRIPLLRAHEQETKLRVVQPLWRPEIAALARAGRHAEEAEAAEVAAYRRELRELVCIAYFNHVAAERVAEVLASARQITVEALRVNRVLEASDKVTHDRVLKAAADDAALDQQQVEAARSVSLSKAGLNFLLNRDLDTEIPRAALGAFDGWLESSEPADLRVDGREELVALAKSVAALAEKEKGARSRTGPTLALAAEAGLQGESYSTNGDARYAQGSLVAEWNLWDGKQRRGEISEAAAERRRGELLAQEVRSSLKLSLLKARDDVRAARASHHAAQVRAEAAAGAFNLIQKRDVVGLVNQLDFTLAREEFVQASLNLEIQRQRLLTSLASLDRAATLTPLP